MNNDSLPSQMDFSVYDDYYYYMVFHFNSFNCIIATIIAAYLIYFKSPSYIGQYKFFLLNITISSFLFDFYMSFIYLPVPLFPSLTMCSHSLLQLLRQFGGGTIGFVFFLIFYASSSLSVIWAFLYRFAAITSRERFLRSSIAILMMLSFQFYYEIPTITLYLISISNRTAITNAVLKTYPKLANMIDPKLGNACAVTSIEGSPVALFFMLSCIIQFALPIPTALTIFYMANKTLDKQKHHLTEKTNQMHRQLLKSLLLQFLVPAISLFTPFTLLGTLLIFRAEVPSLYKILFLMGTMHSFLNTLMLIITIKPYRKAFKIMVLGIIKKMHIISSYNSSVLVTEISTKSATIMTHSTHCPSTH